MKHKISIWSILNILCLLLCACASHNEISNESVSETIDRVESVYTDTQSVSETEPELSVTDITQASTETTISTETTTSTEITTLTETQSEHSPLYINGVSVEEVLLFFNEVCLETEYSYGGDASLVQKWMQPIYYKVYGEATSEDMAVLAEISAQLNSIPGFPGFFEAQEEDSVSIPIHFCSGTELVEKMGNDFTEWDWGATIFWYDDNIIYDAIICIRNDISQIERKSIIVEEIYNMLGPVQDTEYRKDSVIYQYSNDNLSMSKIDVLLLKLLYHPDIICGMNADECEAVIRSLYY